MSETSAKMAQLADTHPLSADIDFLIVYELLRFLEWVVIYLGAASRNILTRFLLRIKQSIMLTNHFFLVVFGLFQGIPTYLI